MQTWHDDSEHVTKLTVWQKSASAEGGHLESVVEVTVMLVKVQVVSQNIRNNPLGNIQ